MTVSPKTHPGAIGRPSADHPADAAATDTRHVAGARSAAAVAALLCRPIAHRGWHDITNGRPENSLAAITAAVDAGFAIEIDVRRSRDGVPMLMHDATLTRVAGRGERVRELSATQLGGVVLTGSAERIPRLVEVLRMVNARVPVLIDAKTRPGEHAAMAGALAHAVACYTGPVVVTSFDPLVSRALIHRAPQVGRGLSAGVPQLSEIGMLRAIGVPFDELWLARYSRPHLICYNLDRLPAPAVSHLRAAGLPVVGWTARTPDAAAAALGSVDALIVEDAAARAIAEAADTDPLAAWNNRKANDAASVQLPIGRMSA